jgi:hypothetical protein
MLDDATRDLRSSAKRHFAHRSLKWQTCEDLAVIRVAVTLDDDDLQSTISYELRGGRVDVAERAELLGPRTPMSSATRPSAGFVKMPEAVSSGQSTVPSSRSVDAPTGVFTQTSGPRPIR